MPEQLERLPLDNFKAVLIGPAPEFEINTTYLVDAPDALDSTHTSAKTSSVSSTNTLSADAYRAASNELSEVVTGDDLFKEDGINGLSDQTIALMNILNGAYKQRAGSFKTSLRNEYLKELEKNWYQYRRQATRYGRLATTANEIYVAGVSFLRQTEDWQIGLTAMVRGFEPFRNGPHFKMEPVVEDQSGQMGLLPARIVVRRLYKIKELDPYYKKWAIRRGDEITTEEATQAKADHEMRRVGLDLPVDD